MFNIFIFKALKIIWKYIHTVLFLFVVPFMISCEEIEQPIDWKTENIPQKVVVEGSVVGDTIQQKVMLSLSGDYFANQPSTKISKATVWVDDGEDSCNFIESDTIPGTYFSEIAFTGRQNTTYTLHVDLPEPVSNTTQITAVSAMPPKLSIDTMIAVLYENPFMINEEDSLFLIVVLKETTLPDITYYLMVKLYRNGEPVFETISDTYLIDDEHAVKDEDRVTYLAFEEEDFVEGDTVGIEIYSITESFYRFVEGVHYISEPPDPFGFSGVRADAIGNINNGKELGFFYTAFISRSSAVVEREKD